MKKVWIGLSITCILIGIFGTAVDLIEGNSLEDTAVVLFVLALFAAFFGWLAWLWRIRSPLKRAGEQAAMAANQGKRKQRCVQRVVQIIKIACVEVSYCRCIDSCTGCTDVAHGELEYLLDILRNSRADYRYCNLYDGFTAGL